jgi:hypothetical protein
MADQTTTSNYPATFLQPFGERLADYTVSELNRPVDISGIMPRVAQVDPFTQAAQQRAANQGGLGNVQYDEQGRITGFQGGTGIGAYQPFLNQAASQLNPNSYQQYMSPYQQDVINQAVQRQQEYGAQQQQQLAASAVGQGAYGGGRYDVARGQLQRGTTEAIGKTVADLQGQNYNQAVARSQQGIANLLAIPAAQQTLESSLQSTLGTMGTGSQAYNQNILNAIQQGENTALNYPFQRIQQATNIFGGLASGTPSTPGVPMTTSPSVAGMGGLGSLAGIAGPLSNVIGSVVQGAGQVLGGVFNTPPTFPTSGPWDNSQGVPVGNNPDEWGYTGYTAPYDIYGDWGLG